MKGVSERYTLFNRLPEGDNVIHQVICFILETSRNIIAQVCLLVYPSDHYPSDYGR